MTYYRDYVAERLNVLKIIMGEHYCKFNEEELIKQIKSEVGGKLETLNIPLVLNNYDGKPGQCKASLKNIHVGVFEYNSIPYYREKLDSLIINDDYTIDECIEEFRAEYVNENISKGMKYGNFVKKFDELEKEAINLGFELTLKK